MCTFWCTYNSLSCSTALMYKHMHTCINIHTYLSICGCTYKLPFSIPHLCIYTYLNTHIHMHTYIIHTCAYACIYIYIYIEGASEQEWERKKEKTHENTIVRDTASKRERARASETKREQSGRELMLGRVCACVCMCAVCVCACVCYKRNPEQALSGQLAATVHVYTVCVWPQV